MGLRSALLMATQGCLNTRALNTKGEPPESANNETGLPLRMGGVIISEATGELFEHPSRFTNAKPKHQNRHFIE